jgi:hypothetical protein
MARNTKHSYREPGSFERIEEAALALADADSENDTDWHRKRARLRAAVVLYRLAERPRRRESRYEQPTLPFERRRT